ncbi:reversion-inducing cysteine-rich protein with Kazal motifs-like [Saccoglossus kowalevskii]|uniref:Reversion-inducing cysteine-rich protein with Kazal motifs-like n=1 Tax=Saccoglossus kowalevskii TaxID=10224 RepID=A0ABM0M1U0_SACKO|nr:PREDICTED: reversion-inducing cysteine-rich protein with Kazal motifs-like [Saccoglossus kowalevskii]
MIKTPFIAVLLIIAAQSQDPQCCHNVNSHPECQEVCDQMALETSHTGRQRHVTNLRTHCPLTLGIFWHCINSTASDIWSDDSTWYGQRCCSEARNQDCGHACQRALSTADIMDSCSVGIEGAIFDCLARYESQQSCCSQAPAGSYCRSKCLMIYELDNPSSEDELTINRYCGGGEGYVQVQQCVHNYTTSLPVRDPTESLHCCEYASDVACKDTCRNVLQTMSRDSDIMDGLTQTCGLPLPQNPLWKCFLWNSGNNDQEEDNGLLTNSALDGAHLECCFKAFSHTCRDLCVKLYTQNGANSNEFDEHCQYQPAETNLLQCLADVQEPCQLGCSGLNYCSNFNGRPTDFFRSCTARSDRGAEDDINLWQNGKIEMPFLDIPVLDINSCEPAMWKAIACTLQIKPCHSKSHVNMICKSDCIAILGKCLDVSRLKRDETAESLCTMLSPNDETTPCISLSQYLEPSSHGARMHEVSIPCHNNPCKNESLSLHELCSINRGSCSYNDVCLDYMCHEGCKLGDGSDFLVPQGSFVNIADAPSMDQACYKVCKCGHSNILEDCQAMKCISTQPCKEGGQIKDHHTHFHVDCNTCSCYAGELICSLRQCLSDESTAEERRRFTGLPCDSADDFLPVCAVNGRTYPNAQIAKCIGFDDNYFEIGTCISKDSCHPNPCLSDEQCISHKQVCLQSTECKQYVCGHDYNTLGLPRLIRDNSG